MELRLAGYFPKRIVLRRTFPDGAPSVVDICSVSHCISDGSENRECITSPRCAARMKGSG
jgi:hypothetical protein